MIIARWTVEAKYGHMQEVIGLLRAWNEEFGAAIGWADTSRLLNGSVGAKESLIVSEVTLDSLSKLDEGFNKLAELKGHNDWSKKLEEHVVSGSNYWEVFRVL